MPSVTPLLNGYSLTSDQGNPAFCSVVLVESGDERVLFDFGHVGRRRKLLTALADRGLEAADITKVVVSHGHWDHLQNADLFGKAQVLHPPGRTAQPGQAAGDRFRYSALGQGGAGRSRPARGR